MAARAAGRASASSTATSSTAPSTGAGSTRPSIATCPARAMTSPDVTWARSRPEHRIEDHERVGHGGEGIHGGFHTAGVHGGGGAGHGAGGRLRARRWHGHGTLRRLWPQRRRLLRARATASAIAAAAFARSGGAGGFGPFRRRRRRWRLQPFRRGGGNGFGHSGGGGNGFGHSNGGGGQCVRPCRWRAGWQLRSALGRGGFGGGGHSTPQVPHSAVAAATTTITDAAIILPRKRGRIAISRPASPSAGRGKTKR